MVKEIEKQVSESVDRVDVKLRKLGVKLISISISCWMIVGSTAVGLALPAYLVKQAVKFEWSKEAQAGVEKPEYKVREPRVSVSPKAYQSQYMPASRSGSGFGTNQVNLRDDIRSIGNTVSETRNLARKMADLAIR